MKIKFAEQDPQVILTNIKNALGGREMARIVTFEIEGDQLIVTVDKLGTSTLLFSHSAEDGGRVYRLTEERIGLTHRAFKSEFTAKIIRVLEQAGGQVS